MKTPGFSEHYIAPIEFLTITQLIQASRCPRRFFYQVGCRLEPIGGSHPALKFGEAIHAAIPFAGVENDMPAAIAKFAEVWKGTEESEKRNTLVGIQILENWNESHRPGTGIYNLERPPQVLNVSGRVSDYEIPFALELPGLRVPILGRIDGLCRRRDNNELWGNEYKTYSKGPFNYQLLDSLDTSTQAIGYTLALRTYLSEPIRGFFFETIMVDSKQRKIDLKPVYVQDHMLEDFCTWVIFWGNMILECEKNQDFPKFRTGCNPYSQFAVPYYTCDFKNACSVPDWTQMRSFFNVGKQHLPFEIPKNFNIHDVKQVEPSIAKPLVDSYHKALAEQEAGKIISEAIKKTHTGLLINGKTY